MRLQWLQPQSKAQAVDVREALGVRRLRPGPLNKGSAFSCQRARLKDKGISCRISFLEIHKTTNETQSPGLWGEHPANVATSDTPVAPTNTLLVPLLPGGTRPRGQGQMATSVRISCNRNSALGP